MFILERNGLMKNCNIWKPATFKIAMQFSHIVSLLFAAERRSGIKVLHLTGHSCFKTWNLRKQETIDHFITNMNSIHEYI